MNYTQTINIDINDPMAKSINLIANENDVDSRYVKVAIYADSVLQDVSGMTATAVFVVDKTLVNDSVACTTAADGVTVPISGLEGYSGMLKVQIKLVDNGTILQTPIAFIVKLTSDIARNAEINENTIGTIADLAQDISSLQSAVSTNSNNISGLQSNVSANTSNISTNANNISTLQSAVSDLEENKADWSDVYTMEEADDYFMIKSQYHWGTGLATSTNNIYGTTISVDMSTGDINSPDQNGSSLKLVGSYQLFGNYCTMNGYVSGIAFNQTCIFSLPVACATNATFKILAYSQGSSVPYYVYSTTDRSKVTIKPVNNSSITGGDSLYFNITYKYK